MSSFITAPSSGTGSPLFDALVAKHEASKLKRAHSPEGETASSKKVKGAQIEPADVEMQKSPAPAATMPVTRHPGAPSNYLQIAKAFTVGKCAIAIGKKAPIGNPYAATGRAWQVNISVDGGRTGTPSMGLSFYMTKNKAFDKPDQRNHFTCGWKPGVRAAGDWMMEDFQCFSAERPSGSEHYPPERLIPPRIREQQARSVSGKASAKNVGKLAYITFMSRSNTRSDYDECWPLNLPYPPEHEEGVVISKSLKKLFLSKKTFQMHIWFLVPERTYELGAPSHLEAIRDAVAAEPQLPHLAQYMDGMGEVRLGFEMDTVGVLGDGMYVQDPVYVLDGKGNRIEATHRSQKPKYITWPRKTTWETLKYFHIWHGVPVVREQQYHRAQMANVSVEWHRVFLQAAPTLKHEGSSMTPDMPLFKRTFFASVRLHRDPTGIHDTIPIEGTKIEVDFYNGNAQVGHEINDEWLWYGIVVPRARSWYTNTKTDFCIMLTKPRKCPRHSYKVRCGDAYFPDERLSLAKVVVKENNTAFIRDLDAINKFCDPSFQQHQLDPLRMAAIEAPDLSPPSQVLDITWGPRGQHSHKNKAIYDSFVEEIERHSMDNPRQIEVLRSASQMARNTVCVGGPPGAGKTRTLVNLIIGLAKIGHKILCTATANSAVDTDAIAVWNGLAEQSEEDRLLIRCLRLEVGSAEHAMILRKSKYADYAGEDAKKKPEYLGPKSPQSDLAIHNALEKIAVDYAAHANKMDAFITQYKDMDDAYKMMQDSRTRTSNVPNGLTLDYHIWAMTEADRYNAEHTEEQENPSARFRDLMTRYIESSGHLSNDDKTAFQDEMDRMTDRVLATIRVLFTTCSNAGSDMLVLQTAFRPTVIAADEAGQASVPSLCVPITSYDSWEGLFLFGDWKQLHPVILGGAYNEFIKNAKCSFLELLVSKGFPYIMLNKSYRMPGSVSQFIRGYIYENQLEDHPKALRDTKEREAARRVCKNIYGINGPHGSGSEYWVINVPYGVSRLEHNDTSMVNHANANAVVQAIANLLTEEDLKPARIKALTYYQGQARLTRRLIEAREWSQDHGEDIDIKRALTVSTVDAFQGKEDDVVIVDFVAAKDVLVHGYKGILAGCSAEHDEDDGNDDETEGYVRFGTVTGHVKDPNRLCLALSRAKACLILVCQESLLLSTLRLKQGKYKNALGSMMMDAKNRMLVYTDTKVRDTHPEGIAASERRQKGEDEYLKRNADQKDLADMGKLIMRARTISQSSSRIRSEPMLRYRTPRGLTTRPFGPPSMVENADAFDENQHRLTEDQSHQAGGFPALNIAPLKDTKTQNNPHTDTDVSMGDETGNPGVTDCDKVERDESSGSDELVVDSDGEGGVGGRHVAQGIFDDVSVAPGRSRQGLEEGRGRSR